MITDKSLTISLLKMFSMFSVIFTVLEGNVNEVTLKCMNCKRKTYLQHKSDKEFIDKMITPFMMNSMLHHVGMSWMISSKKDMDYENFLSDLCCIKVDNSYLHKHADMDYNNLFGIGIPDILMNCQPY